MGSYRSLKNVKVEIYKRPDSLGLSLLLKALAGSAARFVDGQQFEIVPVDPEPGQNNLFRTITAEAKPGHDISKVAEAAIGLSRLFRCTPVRLTVEQGIDLDVTSKHSPATVSENYEKIRMGKTGFGQISYVTEVRASFSSSPERKGQLPPMRGPAISIK
jgi:hypothetical protein